MTDNLAIAGVYRIRNTVNGKVYVGSALNIQQRLGQHRACLRAGRHDTDVSGERNPMHGVSPKERMTPEVYAGWRACMSESHRRAHMNAMLREWS